jgi:hypothetical protein
MDMTTETQTLTTVTVKDAKPSEIVRSLAPERWAKSKYRLTHPDGTYSFCSIGILLEEAGVQWGPGSPDFGVIDRPSEILESTYGLPPDVQADAIIINDKYGKDAVADYLESKGF